MMRKGLWISALLFLFAVIVTPCAKADSVTFTCTVDYNNPAPGNPCFEAVPTAPDVTFQGPTLVITWYSQTFDLTLPSDWHDTDANISWGASNDQFSIYDPEHPFEAEPLTGGHRPFCQDGTGMSEGGPLTFGPSIASAPEPGTPRPHADWDRVLVSDAKANCSLGRLHWSFRRIAHCQAPHSTDHSPLLVLVVLPRPPQNVPAVPQLSTSRDNCTSGRSISRKLSHHIVGLRPNPGASGDLPDRMSF